MSRRLLRIALIAVAAVAAVALLFLVVFPWVDRMLADPVLSVGLLWDPAAR